MKIYDFGRKLQIFNSDNYNLATERLPVIIEYQKYGSKPAGKEQCLPSPGRRAFKSDDQHSKGSSGTGGFSGSECEMGVDS